MSPERDRLDPSQPIGVFDSGLGGLTVVAELHRVAPRERIVYLGDTARVPYGTRSAETVIRYARGCARLLTERKVKALVVACNTVSAVALDILRAELDLPVVGVVEPGARAAVRAASEVPGDGGRRIGVLGTAGTIASGAYPRAVAAASTRHEVIGQPAPLLVPLAEEGWVEGELPDLAVRRYVKPLTDEGVGVIVLGCTHYPLLAGTIGKVSAELVGRAVPIVDSAAATARAVADLLTERGMASRTASASPLELLVSDRPASFEAVASRFLGRSLPAATQVDIPQGTA